MHPKEICAQRLSELYGSSSLGRHLAQDGHKELQFGRQVQAPAHLSLTLLCCLFCCWPADLCVAAGHRSVATTCRGSRRSWACLAAECACHCAGHPLQEPDQGSAGEPSAVDGWPEAQDGKLGARAPDLGEIHCSQGAPMLLQPPSAGLTTVRRPHAARVTPACRQVRLSHACLRTSCSVACGCEARPPYVKRCA